MTFPQNPYPIYGFIRNGVGNPTVGQTVRVQNLSTLEYEDVTTESDGSYISDLSNLPSGYEPGQQIKVLCLSISNTVLVDLISYEGGRRIDLVAYLNLKINNITVENVVSLDVIRSLGERVWTTNIDMENINGNRTNKYQMFQGIQVDVDEVTLLKGRTNKTNVNQQHHLFVAGENYSSYLNDRIVQNENYTGVSIYDIITKVGTGLISKYVPQINIANVANDANTQKLITKTFEKQTVMECITYLASVASVSGYDFYVDNNIDLHFQEHKSIDSGIILTNVGENKNVLSWDWKEKEGRDIYNKVFVYYGVGGTASVERNDLNSQTNYGVREYPPITDTTISTVAAANIIGDRILNKYSNAYREGTITCKTTTAMLSLNPGDLVSLALVGSGIAGSVFPMQFSFEFSGPFGPQYMVMEVKHSFPKFMSEIRVSEYQRDVISLLTSGLRNTKDIKTVLT